MTHLKSKLLLALLALATGAAQAGPVAGTFIPGVNDLFDFNEEYLIDRSYTNPTAPGFGVVGQVDPGDSLRGLLDFKRANSVAANLGAGTPNDEMTGVFQAMVASVTCGISGCAYVFVPDPAFEAIYGAGAMIALYDDPSQNVAHQFTDPTAPVPCAVGDDGTVPPCTVPPSSADVSTGPYLTEEAFIALAGDGTLMWVLGIDPTNPSNFWVANTSGFLGNNILGAFGATSGSFAGFADVFLDVLTLGPAGVPVQPITCVPGVVADFCSSVTLGGVSNLSTPFEVSSQTRTNFQPALPEPGSLALLGIGLAGLGAMVRRRKS